MSEYENAPAPASRYRSVLRKLDAAQIAAAQAVAHAEALEASREAVIAQRDDNWRRLCEANTRAEALEAALREIAIADPKWALKVHQLLDDAALTGPGEPERCPTCGSLEPRLMDSAWMYANDVTRCPHPWHEAAAPTPSEGNPR